MKNRHILLALSCLLLYIGVRTVLDARERDRLMSKMKRSIDTNQNGELTADEVSLWLAKHASTAHRMGLHPALSSACAANSTSASCARGEGGPGLEKMLVSSFDSDGDGLISDGEFGKLSDAMDDMPAPPTDMVDFMNGSENKAWNDALLIGAVAFTIVGVFVMYADNEMLTRSLEAMKTNISDAQGNKSRVEEEKKELARQMEERTAEFQAKLQEKQEEVDAAESALIATKERYSKEQDARDKEVESLKNVIANKATKIDVLEKAKSRMASIEEEKLAALKQLEEDQKGFMQLQDDFGAAKAEAEKRASQLQEMLDSKSKELDALNRKLTDQIQIYEDRLKRELCTALSSIATRFPGDSLKYTGSCTGDEETTEYGFKEELGFLNDAMGLSCATMERITDNKRIRRRGLPSVADAGFTVDVFGSEDNKRIFVGAKFLGSGKTGACIVDNLNDRTQQFVMKKYAISNAHSDPDLKKELWAHSIPADPNGVVVRYERAIITRFTGYILMEKARGVDWLTRANQGVMGEETARECFRQLIQGVKHLHDNGVLHLDIKPMNIMIDESGPSPVVKLIDLGFAFHRAKEAVDSMKFCGGECEPPSLALYSDFSTDKFKRGQADDIFRATCSLWIVLAAAYPAYPYDPLRANVQRLSPECHEFIRGIVDGPRTYETLKNRRIAHPKQWSALDEASLNTELLKAHSLSCDAVLRHSWLARAAPAGAARGAATGGGALGGGAGGKV